MGVPIATFARSASVAARTSRGEGFSTGSSSVQAERRKSAASDARSMREKYRKSDLEAFGGARHSRRHAIHCEPALQTVDVLVADRQGAVGLRVHPWSRRRGAWLRPSAGLHRKG